MTRRRFSCPGAFAAFLATIPTKMQADKRRALERAARLVEREARSRLGEYQDAAGPFDRWPALSTYTMEDRARQGFPPDEPLLRTGALRDSIGHRVEKDEAVIGSDSPVAVAQELGTARIPPRSFLGSAAASRADEIVEILGRGATAALTGRRSRTDIDLPD